MCLAESAQEISMNRSILSRVALVVSVFAMFSAASVAVAAEGVQKTSISKGAKCWQASVVQADGSIKRQQVCGKYGV